MLNALSAESPALIAWMEKTHPGLIEEVFKRYEVLNRPVKTGNRLMLEWLMSPARGVLQQKPSPSTLATAMSNYHYGFIRFLVCKYGVDFGPKKFAKLQLRRDVRHMLPPATWIGSYTGYLYYETNKGEMYYTDPYDALHTDKIKSLFLAMAKVGDLEFMKNFAHILKSKVNLKEYIDIDVLKQAVNYGNLPIVEWLTDSARGMLRVLPNPQIVDAAFASGNAKIFVHFLNLREDLGSPYLNINILNQAATKGKLEIVQWLTSEARGPLRISPDNQTLEAARQSGNREVIGYIERLLGSVSETARPVVLH